MWACIKRCLERVLPGVGAFTLALIVGGIVALIIGTGGVAAVTGTAVLSIIGVSIVADALGTLIGCIGGCIISDAPAG